MFIGHFGVALAAKKVSKKPSLGTLFMASQFIDLLWPLFLILGLEKVIIDPGNTVITPLNFIYYPFTHSLLGVAFWAILFGGIYFLLKKDRTTALILGLLVLSHWFLDLLVHRPDLLLIPGIDLKLGLGIWNSLPLTLILEGTVFVLGIHYYQKATSAKNKTGVFSLWGLVIFLLFVYLGNLFGPIPESAEAIGVVGLSQWLLIGWGYWIDKNRDPRQLI